MPSRQRRRDPRDRGGGGMSQHATEIGRQSRGDVWVRRGCALLVAAVAAYSSYAHQRHFALVGGADQISAALWPLSVDGLVVLASLGLVRARSSTTMRARLALWVAFLLGVAVSLAANIAAAPTLSWQPVLVAGWPPARGGTGRALSQPRPDRHHPDAARDHTGCRTRTRDRRDRECPRPKPRLVPRPVGERLVRLRQGDPGAWETRVRKR
jgi:Protein of unknown function (DUF2637)